jgi:hypothetical protein
MFWKITVGVSLVVAGLYYILASELLRAFPNLETARTGVAAALAGLGAVVGLAGWSRRRTTGPSEEAEEAASSLALDLRYWGCVCILLAGISLFVRPFRHASAPLIVAAPKPSPVITNAPVVFPTLKIQGCILGENRPVVIIDGRSYGEGDLVRGLIVKSVSRDGVVMEKGGATKCYAVP